MLVENWRHVWKWYSTHALLLATVTPVAMTEAESYLGEKMPLEIKVGVSALIFFSGFIGRIVAQGKRP